MIEEAVPLLQSLKFAKFDETVEMTMRLGVDPKHADQMVRGTVVLPHGLGRSKKVLVIASGDKQKEAQDAGADDVGGEELVQKIQGGLMPNPKTGTVTVDVAKAVEEIKAGKVEYRVDKAGVIHAPIGKTSFDKQKLIDNANALAASVLKAKPVASKGKYVKGIHMSSTMGPGIRIDTVSVEAGAKGRDGDH